MEPWGPFGSEVVKKSVFWPIFFQNRGLEVREHGVTKRLVAQNVAYIIPLGVSIRLETDSGEKFGDMRLSVSFSVTFFEISKNFEYHPDQ